MSKTKIYLNYFFTLTVLAGLVFSSQGFVSAQPLEQNVEKQDVPPLLPNVNWEITEGVQKTLEVQGQTITVTGEVYDTLINFPDKNPEFIFEYYSSENLASLGWKFIGGKGVELVYTNEAGNYLTVEIVNCQDSKENFCVYVWQNIEKIAIEKSGALKSGPIGFNKTTPANGSIMAMPATTYQLLQWTDALLPETDRYQYCIDTTNNNVCDGDNWITRDSLYSGGPSDFTLTAGQTYYWQVRSRDTLIYANGGGNWWSFSISPAAISFNKTTPTNGSTIAMPATTHQLLQWTDALLPATDRYQYCIDTTNNNACDGNNWITRDSLYSGGPGDFALSYGQTYYWQVRARDANVYANSGAWWSFTIQAILPAPSVVSIVRTIPTTTGTDVASVVYTVTFSQNVTGVDITDFALTTSGGVTGASITTVGGVNGTNTRTVTVDTGAGSGTLRLDFIDNDTVQNIQSAPVGGVGINNGNFTTGEVYLLRSASLVNSVLPTSRSTVVGNTVTIFNSVINVGTNIATDVTLSLNPAPTGTFVYYQTNCATNAIISGANPSIDIDPSATACYVLSFTPSAAFAATNVHVIAQATNTSATTLLPGVNTWLLRASNVAGPDIIALTTTTDFHQMACSGPNAFAVAMFNVGSVATGDITVSANTGSISLPLSVLIQETDPVSGVVIGDHILQNVLANENRTVAVFVTFNGCIVFDPATKRIFIEFRDASNNIVGSTSTAVSTNR